LDAETWERVIRSLALSPRQALLVRLLLQGKRDKDMAAEMELGLPTVRTYFERVFRRVGVTDRVQLVIRVFETAMNGPRGCPQLRCQRDDCQQSRG
jgi:DNA-binding NarL/FixJ family response regulator